MKIPGKDMYCRSWFRTWEDFLNCAEKADSEMPTNERSSRDDDRPNWHGTKDFAEAMALARFGGWKKGEEETRQYSVELMDIISDKIEKQNIVYDIEGHGIDVARFVDGEPECWQKLEQAVMQGPGNKLIDIVYDMTADCGKAGSVFVQRGGTVTALAELLEYAGHRTAITLCFACGNFPGDALAVCETYVQVKEHDQPLDLERVSFALAHPSSFRRLGFSIWETAPYTIRRAIGISDSGGYGSTQNKPQVKGDINISANRFDCDTPAKCQEFILGELARQGVAIRKDFVGGSKR